MLNWFDLMRQAQCGAGFDNMARQFGLRPEQVQLAVSALLPAFALGLQRQAANPNAMAQFLQTMMAGQYAAFFDSAAQAFSTEGRREGQAIVDRLFGSDEVTKRVAQQAAQFSGIGTEVLNQLLPLVAAILAGGMFKVMKSQGEMMGTMMAAWQGAAPGGGAEDRRSGSEAKPSAGEAANPFDAMMAGFVGKAPPEKAKRSKPEKPEKPAAPATPVEAWGQMMETGQEMQRRHLESLQAIFDSAWGRGDRR
jgi:hypothetical protein